MAQNVIPINNHILPWDGTVLGAVADNVVVREFAAMGRLYSELCFVHTDGKPIHIICTLGNGASIFPVLLDELKVVFGVAKRGTHRIQIGRRHHILYYVPISMVGEIVYEPQLTQLSLRSPFRKDLIFKNKLRELVMFRDICGVASCGEASILLRPGPNHTFTPIGSKETGTVLTNCGIMSPSVIGRALFNKWFGEEIEVSAVVAKMVGYDSDSGDMASTLSVLRNKVEAIIIRIEPTELSYASMIVNQVSKYLMEIGI